MYIFGAKIAHIGSLEVLEDILFYYILGRLKERKIFTGANFVDDEVVPML